MRVIDISVDITHGMMVFPGDPPVDILPTSRIARGDAANISEVRMGTHTGTHIDPPLHFLNDGANLSQLPLQRIMGECFVADLTILGENITREDLYPKRNAFKNKILLLKTRNSGLLKDEEFHQDYTYLTENGANFLVEQGVKLVGIDYLSIGKYQEGEAVHRILLGKGIPIVETLDLSGAEEGEYLFVFLPLKITGGDGGPGRAVLIKNEV